MKTFTPSGVWSSMQVMLGLVALYLILSRGPAAAQVVKSAGSTLDTLFKILQGRGGPPGGSFGGVGGGDWAAPRSGGGGGVRAISTAPPFPQLRTPPVWGSAV